MTVDIQLVPTHQMDDKPEGCQGYDAQGPCNQPWKKCDLCDSRIKRCSSCRMGFEGSPGGYRLSGVTYSNSRDGSRAIGDLLICHQQWGKHKAPHFHSLNRTSLSPLLLADSLEYSLCGGVREVHGHARGAARSWPGEDIHGNAFRHGDWATNGSVGMWKD